MTTEYDFHDRLDAHIDDWQTRLVFADWLQEHDDPRAEGYRALGVLRKYPLTKTDHAGTGVPGPWFGFAPLGGRVFSKNTLSVPAPEHGKLPGEWLAAARKLSDGRWVKNWVETRYQCGPLRRDLENLIALAFAELPEPKRGELLSGVCDYD